MNYNIGYRTLFFKYRQFLELYLESVDRVLMDDDNELPLQMVDICQILKPIGRNIVTKGSHYSYNESHVP